MKKLTLLLALTMLLSILVGCSGDKTSAAEDKQLRNDFSRPLNEEELAQMGKADPPAPPQKGE